MMYASGTSATICRLADSKGVSVYRYIRENASVLLFPFGGSLSGARTSHPPGTQAHTPVEIRYTSDGISVRCSRYSNLSPSSEVSRYLLLVGRGALAIEVISSLAIPKK